MAMASVAVAVVTMAVEAPAVEVAMASVAVEVAMASVAVEVVVLGHASAEYRSARKQCATCAHMGQ